MKEVKLNLQLSTKDKTISDLQNKFPQFKEDKIILVNLESENKKLTLENLKDASKSKKDS